MSFRVLHLLLLVAIPLALPSSAGSELSSLTSTAHLFSAKSPFASPQSSDDEKYSLRGIVLNSVTGEAVRGALVQIYSRGQDSLLTGPDGKFQFDNLPNGQTYINVRKPGFFTNQEIEEAFGSPPMFTVGPDTAPVTLKLIPEGVIYGHISEDDGEPIESLSVQLMAQVIREGRKTWQPGPSATTDEDGAFRIAELRPGNYFLSAGPSRNPLSFPSGLSQPGARGIPEVFYPNGSDLSAAAPLPIAPGKRFEVNLTVSPQPFYRVSGSITGYPTGNSVNCQLYDSAGKNVGNNARFDPGTGAFRIISVPAGFYTLRAVSQGEGVAGKHLTASVSLNVNSDLSGIHLLLVPAVNIPIHLSVVSSHSAMEQPSTPQNWFPAYVQLVSRSDGFSQQRYGSQQVGEQPNISLELQNVISGTYRVEINPNGMLYAQSATSGTTNLLESDLIVGAGGSVQPIEIVMSDDVAFLNGSVSSDNQPAMATVLVLSDHSPSQTRIQRTDPNGVFNIAFLPPGEYKLLAVDRADQLEYANPDVMRKYLPKAKDIRLSPDQTSKVELELVKVGD